MQRAPYSRVVVRATAEKKSRFAALAARRGVSQSGLLRQLMDLVLAHCPVEPVATERHGETRERHPMTVRLRPGDRNLLRARAQRRGMNYTTYAAVLIRAHLRANPPMPLDELAQFERSLAEVSAMARRLTQVALTVRGGRSGDPGCELNLATVVEAVQRLREELREVVRVNRISWESADVEVAP